MITEQHLLTNGKTHLVQAYMMFLGNPELTKYKIAKLLGVTETSLDVAAASLRSTFEEIQDLAKNKLDEVQIVDPLSMPIRPYKYLMDVYERGVPYENDYALS